MPQQLRQGLALIALAATVYLTGLGWTRLWDDDETYFAETAREMYARDDLIVPWFNQALFAHKPPFMYWMMIGAYHLFGVTEFASRVPSAVFGAASALLVWRLGRILYSPRVGFWAGVILATSLNYIVIARAATCDAELLFFCTLPLYVLVRRSAQTRLVPGESEPRLVWLDSDASQPPTWSTWALLYAAMGVAVMVKGPIGVVLPTAVLGLFLLMQQVARDSAARRQSFAPDQAPAPVPGTIGVRLWGGLRYLGALLAPKQVALTIWNMRPLTALAMVLLVAGPWFVAVSLRTRGDFLKGFFGEHHFHRFTATMDNHTGPIYYYLLAICVGFFPWIIFLKPTCDDLIRRLRDPQTARPADRLLIAWFAVWVGFFSLGVTKFPHYVLPAYPALALATACFLDHWIRRFEIYPTRWRRAAWLTVGVVGVGILAIVPFVARSHLPGEPWLGLAGLPLIAGAALAAWQTEQRRIERALATLTVTAGVFAIGLFAFAAVRVDRYQNTPPFAAAIHRWTADGDPRIGVYQCFRPGYVFYCQDRVEQFWDDQSAGQFFQDQPGNSFLITTLADYERLAEHFPPQIGILQQSPWFLKSGETLVLLGDRSSGIAAQPSVEADSHRQ